MILTHNGYKQLRPIDIELMLDGGGDFGGGGFSPMMSINGNGGGSGSFAVTAAPPALVGENKPTQQFDLSVIAGLSPTSKFRGNLVRDIQEAYQTYISGSPIGRGGQYAVDAARRYGTTLTEAARGYLVAVGLPTLANILPDTGGGGTGTGGGTGGGGTDVTDQIKKVQDTLTKQLQDTQKNFEDQLKKIQEGFQSNNTIKLLSDQIAALFGAPVNNPPLQSQATGYTPVTASSPLGGAVSGGGSSIGLIVIIGVVGIIGYFLYKRYAS